MYRDELRFPTYQDVVKLCPVFLVIINKQGNLRNGQNVLQTCEPFWSETLRFLVYGRIENVSIICKADRHNMRRTFRIERRKPRDPRLLQFCANGATEDVAVLGRHLPSLTELKPHSHFEKGPCQAANRAFLSRKAMIPSRLVSGIPKTARLMPASRYSARAPLSAGAPNTLTESVEKSRPAAEAA